MGGPPARRRDPLRSLGNLGATTLGDRSVGGGHDGLLGDMVRKGGKGWSPKARYRLVDLSDVDIDYDDEETAPAAGDVPTWDPTALGEDGGAWVASPGGGGGLLDLTSYTGSGSFSDGIPFEWESSEFTVQPETYQLVLVTVDVTVTDTLIGTVIGTAVVGGVSIDVGFPTPWQVEVKEPAATDASLGNGSGSCGTTVPVWLHNDTDTETGLTVSVYLYGTSTSFVSAGFSGTVDVRADSLHPPLA